jgi:hypothetical protein
MWDLAHAALAKCTTLTIFGFSFPTSDCLICDVVRSAVRDSKALRDVIIIDRSPDKIALRVASLLPPTSNAQIVTCAVPLDGSNPAWIPASVP